MNFDERKSTAREMVMEFLDSLSPPRGVDPQGLSEMINNIADAFARKMPVAGDFRENAGKVFTKLRDTHMSNSWPPQAAFVLAMPASDAMGRKAAESFSVESYPDHYSEMMRNRQPVPESALWGSIASKLPRRELERYRGASVMSWIELYRDDAESLMKARYGTEVLPYFPSREAAQ